LIEYKDSNFYTLKDLI